MTQVEVGQGNFPLETEGKTTGVIVPEGAEVSSLVALAIRERVPVEVLERLVALQERVTARNAETAMAEALAAFQATCPPIPKTITAEVRKNGVKAYEYQFAPLDEVVRVIRPHLTRTGLSFVHDSTVDQKSITVTCTLQHVEGAKRTATFHGPFDESGGKNAIQQVASARSYGRRYTLMDVLGLTTAGEDDDGQGGKEDVPLITQEQGDELLALASEVKADVRRFVEFLGVEDIRHIPAARFVEAKGALEQKRKPPK